MNNILFFLLPKVGVEFVYEDFTVRQAVEKMSFHRYSVIPSIDRDGKYVRSISEGDILHHIREAKAVSLEAFEDIPLHEVKTARNYEPVQVDATMDDLIHMIINQN
ncbi:MAG: CBS domain-containing protein, partial [Bacilli bacterium]|nr:CBS domain-containing protein [Bacilli bacterium]